MNEDFITLGDGLVKADEGVIVNGSKKYVRAEGEANEYTHAQPYDPNGEKWCYKCQFVKPLSEFPTDPRSSDGHDNRCERCEAERKRQSRRVKAEQTARKIRPYRRRTDL